MTETAKVHYALKMMPPRPTFAQDMTDGERAVMQKHVIYWKELMAGGKVVLYGPVSDPRGTYGFGVVEVADEAEVRALTANDPAAEINQYEFYPMRAMIRKSAGG